jgi:diguanylate cyclase (GGDEF)-like protein
MDTLLNKIKEAGLDPASVSGEDGIIFWGHIRAHIASSSMEQAQCYIISSEYRAELKQFQLSSEDLKAALALLQLPENAELILSIRESLSERLIELGEYSAALDQYVLMSNIAVENSYIDEYATAILGMANLCRIYGDPARALRYYQKIDAIDHAISTRSLRLRFKIGMLTCFIALERTTAARELVEECEELSILVSDKSLAGLVLLLEARLELSQNNVEQALNIIANVPYATGNNYIASLSCLLKIELAFCFARTGKAHMAEMLLINQHKKLQSLSHPELSKELYQALSYIYEQTDKFDEALKYEKMAYRVESDLMRKIPISELGTGQLRRLTRFELQLKLILSELENRELKETTETQQLTVAQLQQDVFTDPLTKLHNRRWLESKLKDLLLHETGFAFLVVDIDHFKSINDELSHLVGDKAIVNVSAELAGYFKFRDASCVRFGGEEFLVILENTTLERAAMHADNFRERIYQFPWEPILGERGLTVSVGVTLHREGENTQRTFYRADKALYRAKANGRNQICTES